MSIPKTLIIGLGGLGSDAVCTIYKKFQENTKNSEIRKLVRFLALDTDGNEIPGRRKIMKYDDVIQTSADTNISIGRLVDNIKDDSTIEQWFQINSPQLQKMLINDGAGQVRGVSRVAFSHAIHSGKLDHLEQLIDELNNIGAGIGNNINIHIVCSLAGGTGAGSFLQMAYYVKEILYRKGIQDSKVLGYFLLADTFLHDTNINLKGTKEISIMANSYACIKELTGLYSLSADQQIPFEYGDFTKKPIKITPLNSDPYDFTYLIDFESKDGTNLGAQRYYRQQIEDFLYLNAFSPLGKKTRSEAVNNVIDSSIQGGTSRFGLLGVSKIIYPLDNLLHYFSIRRLRDSLQHSWIRIDVQFRKQYEEYLANLEKGVIGREPNIKEYFIDNIKSLAISSDGKDGYIFKNIYNSTQVIGNKGVVKISKAQHLVKALKDALVVFCDANNRITNLSKLEINESFLDKTHDDDNDLSTIQGIQSQLEALKDEVFSFIENNIAIYADTILVNDIKSDDYIRIQSAHTINYYILQENKAMHPLAVRYFLYDIQLLIDNEIKRLSEENKALKDAILKYDEIYDIKSDDGADNHIENAEDAYRIYKEQNEKVLKRLSNWLGQSNSLKEFKENFKKNTNNHAQRLKKYAIDKLLEEVLLKVKIQINHLVKNIENMFSLLPEIIKKMNDTLDGLLTSEDNNPAYLYVLYGQKHRDYIYEHEISTDSKSLFPEDLSRLLYEILYKNTANKFSYSYTGTNSNGSFDQGKFKEIFATQIVNEQKKEFKINYKDKFSGYNIFEAIKKEAEIDGANFSDKLAYYSRESRRRSAPYGGLYDFDAAKIKSWSVNSNILQSNNLSKDDQNVLFVDGSIVADDYFDPKEIIREESIYVLSIEQNFPKFHKINTSAKYSSSKEGLYYTAYKHRMAEFYKNRNVPTPHLDVRWSEDDYFLDIGESKFENEMKFARAFLWGISYGLLIQQQVLGTTNWFFVDINNNSDMIKINSKSGHPIINNPYQLINDGLRNHRYIVDTIIGFIDNKKEEAKNYWANFMTDPIVALSTIEILNKLQKCQIEGKNILDFVGSSSMELSKIAGLIIDEIIDTMEYIGGKNQYNFKKAVKFFDYLNIQDKILKSQINQKLEALKG